LTPATKQGWENLPIHFSATHPKKGEAGFPYFPGNQTFKFDYEKQLQNHVSGPVFCRTQQNPDILFSD
jgi:hypothetical protein